MSGILEVCANSYTSAVAAQLGGAKRVEFCDNLAEGGTTPSYGQIKLAKQNLNIAIWPIIRPRGGDFLYSELEFNLMKEDVKICKSLNCEGVVIGILKEDGSVDITRCQELIELAKPMKVAFHRAFDMCNDMEKALEDLIGMGIVRVLSSGGASSAYLGINQLAKLIKQANGRITIMPGAGINAGNIKELYLKTGATDFHASAKAFVESKMEYRNVTAKMGSIEDEYRYELTSEEKVRELVAEIEKFD
ncbi:copper homeostasis protein [Pedobacter psychrotolerans]|uniref:PF03932 family protein CutC n=1 Tax=Pedobacter psychrotolerans TaxID=1843235 RepID=A0A4R2H7H3_9SPHI|nr:copper homeostasis protein CutC [Pedobacter psychrotolerans]TCO22363.1 copper homeostasis protein [Pedobacter psychrotolerans]GGE64030.1 copper homeostasis protein CutC [Pedobacter psychrotolerans]